MKKAEGSKFEINSLKFDKKGLVPAIIQDYKDGQVLMLGYMNRESLRRTLRTKKVHFYSRSRKKLWLKGESSGHFQIVKSLFFDCDKDTLLIKVRQIGGACHTGFRSCFYREIAPERRVKIIGKKVFEPKKVY